MSSLTEIFLTGRRASRAGLMRAKISGSGRFTVRRSCSPPELAMSPGASRRSSPKEIFTVPEPSWLTMASALSRRVAWAAGADMILARNSSGSALTTDASGISISFSDAGKLLMPCIAVAVEIAEAVAAEEFFATGGAAALAGGTACGFPAERKNPRKSPAKGILTDSAIMICDFVLALPHGRRNGH